MAAMNARPLSPAVLVVLFSGVLLRGDEPAKDDMATGEVRRFQHAGHIYQVAFSPDGKLIATDDQLWEAATGKKVRTLPLPPLDRRPLGHFWLAFSPDSRHVAVHRYNDIVLVEVATGKEVWQTKLKPRDTSSREGVPRLAFTPDGKHLLSARNDEALVRVWSAATGKEVRHFAYDSLDGGQSGAQVNSFGVSADGNQVVVHSQKAGHEGGPVVLEVETGKELTRYQISSEEAWSHFSAPSPDGRHLIYSRNAKDALHLLDLKTGKETRRFAGVGKYPFLVAFSPDGKHVAASVRAAGHSDDWIQCWEVSTGKSVRVSKGHKGQITSLAFSPDGQHVLSGSEDKTARLWRLKE
jgi:WD40 repeat protein